MTPPLTLLICLLAVGATTSAVAAVGVGRFAQRMGAVDRPDGHRKLHGRVVPLWGGIAVLVALATAIAVAQASVPDPAGQFARFSTVALIGAAMVCLTGAVDDRWLLSARTKLLLQTAAVLPIVWAGYRIEGVMAFGVPIQFGWFGWVITVTWLVGCINAMNFLDGMDGLASLVGVIVSLMTAMVAAMVGHGHATVIAVCLAGALAGFLIHNLPPARMFLGDSGSMLIGLMLGLLGIAATMKTPTTLAIAVPVLVMALPLLDTTLAIVRRKLTGRRVDLADRQHIHHRLLDRGLSQWQALLMIGGICLVTGIASIVAVWLRSDTVAWIVAALLVAVPIHRGWFGHHEFTLLRRAAGSGLALLARRMSGPGTEQPTTAEAAERSMGFAEAWDVLIQQAQARAAGCVELSLWRDDEHPRCHRWLRRAFNGDNSEAWQIAVTLRRADGHTCRLAVAGSGAMAAEETPTGLENIVRSYAAYFAERADTIPGLAMLDQPPPAGPLDPTADSRAA